MNSDQLPIVWVIQEGKNNYSSAEKFGTVQFVTTSDMICTPNSQQNRNVEFDLKAFISGYIPTRDYIIPSGNPMVVAQAMMSMPSLLPHSSHNLLKWDGRRAEYIPFKVAPINQPRTTA